jgi:hypothetical protein
MPFGSQNDPHKESWQILQTNRKASSYNEVMSQCELKRGKMWDKFIFDQDLVAHQFEQVS